MEEVTKKNWSVILLWIVSILLIGAVSMLFIEVKKDKKESLEVIRIVYETIQHQTHPDLVFTDGLQKINDKIMINIDEVTKYLDGYKVNVGVLNTSAVSLTNVKIKIYKKLDTFNYKYKARILINDEIKSGEMAHVDFIIKDTSEEDITKGDWIVEFGTATYSYRDAKK